MHEMTDNYLQQILCGEAPDYACGVVRTRMDGTMHKVARVVVRGMPLAVSRLLSHKIFREVSDTLSNEIAHEIVHALAYET